ncbi:hypothetical protein ACJX0J_005959, partial [Zea mays]
YREEIYVHNRGVGGMENLHRACMYIIHLMHLSHTSDLLAILLMMMIGYSSIAQTKMRTMQIWTWIRKPFLPILIANNHLFLPLFLWAEFLATTGRLRDLETEAANANKSGTLQPTENFDDVLFDALFFFAVMADDALESEHIRIVVRVIHSMYPTV